MKKYVALLLSLVMVLSLCPVTALAQPSGSVYSAWNDGETLSEGMYDLDGETITINWPLIIAGTVTVQNGTIQRGSDYDGGEMFFVNSGKSLTLDSVTIDGGAVWSGAVDNVLKRGTKNIGATNSSELIYVGIKSTAVLTNCTLQNNECSDSGGGGAVSVDERGSLTATNTTMCNNAKTAGQAGAIKAYTGATVNLIGCELYGNEAVAHGGAIQIWGGNSPGNIVHMTMTDCTVRNNKAGGVGGGIAVSDYSDFTMIGGTITNNATTDYLKRGGGVGFSDKNTAMSISGNAVISGNVAEADVNNLYVGTNDCNKLAVGEMGSNASVGVTMSSPGVFSSGGASYTGNFKSDNQDYIVVTAGSNLQLVSNGTTIYTVTFDVNGYGTAPPAQTVAEGGTATEPKAPFASGRTFGGWFTDTACTDAYVFTTSVSSNLTLYAKWTTPPQPTTYTVTYANGGGTGTDPTQAPVAENGTFTLAQNPYTRTGYTFAGWNDGTNIYAAGDTYTMPDGDVTLTAQWTENSGSQGGGQQSQWQNYNGPIYVSPGKADPEIEPAKTFDGGIALAVAVSVLSVTGSAVLLRKKED